ncbi:phosphoribosyl-AMP cyclohydrolase [Alicyclobacillus macrosporangiidus]|uniref:phosphoribosyl-AMP cyclohydrolase n=1 Tax=Alicyclobacillus macrosporangiidus TaxID=392015 RepID=UPI000AEB740C|nr:phosphoribosyl-AMP cyclohydrolase [Alicyclobacillus macrosporangiidus]
MDGHGDTRVMPGQEAVAPAGSKASTAGGADTAAEEAVWLDAVRYDKDTGLVPVVVQDARNGRVLMLAYANREALKRTFGTGQAWFWSRSRQSFWCKGATSGNVQRVVEVRIDCDGDAVLYRVEPAGPACHTGAASCFYRVLQHKESVIGSGPDGGGAGEPGVSDGEAAPGAEGPGTANDSSTSAEPAAGEDAGGQVLERLWRVIEQRWTERPQGSYTTYLFERGVDKVAKKVGEESAEVVIAAKNAVESAAGRAELAEESADLLYHLLALWKVAGIRPQDVFHALQKREK